jgi:hypothetical protein
MSLRENLNLERVEELRNKKIEIHYEIQIPNLGQWSLKDTILNAKRNITQHRLDEKNLNIY